MHTQPARPRRSRHKRLPAAAVSAVLAISAAGVGPASATLVDGEPVPSGRNITVFHNIDFVVAAGWPSGEVITVEVVRNGVVIGSATGPSVDTVEGPALEVNHGPAGTTPAPGDCWDGHTPDVRPGDTIRVRHGAGLSSVVVDDITFSGPAHEVAPVEGENHTIEVRGIAKYADGEAIPLARLDSSGFRDGQLRGVPDEVVADPAVDGGFIMRYHPPYTMERNVEGLDEAQRKASLLTSGGHATGFGHTEVLPAEAMLVDGIDDVPGPAAGCEDSPAAVHAVGAMKPAIVNQAVVASGEDLTVEGSSFDATEVTVTVGSLETTAVLTPVAGGTGQQTWRATFPMAGDAGVAALPDGALSVSMVAQVQGAAMPGRGRALVKDTAAPPVPSANPVPGTHQGTQLVSLFSEDGARLFYTLNDGPQTPYSREISISEVKTNTLTAFAEDAAGNRSALFTGSYTITSPAPPASGGGGGGGGAVPPPAPAPVPDPVPAPQPVTVPAAPEIGAATAGRGSASVVWTAPADDGGARITGYRVHVFRGDALTRTVLLGAEPTSATVLGLVNGAPYRFAVTAVNEAGVGARSALSTVVRPQSVPGVVRRVRALVNDPGGRVTSTVTWVQPRTDGGSRITGYLVRAHRVGADGALRRPRLVADLAPAARTVTVRLAPATYRFTVRAVNRVGGGRWSAVSNQRRAR